MVRGTRGHSLSWRAPRRSWREAVWTVPALEAWGWGEGYSPESVSPPQPISYFLQPSPHPHHNQGGAERQRLAPPQSPRAFLSTLWPSPRRGLCGRLFVSAQWPSLCELHSPHPTHTHLPPALHSVSLFLLPVLQKNTMKKGQGSNLGFPHGASEQVVLLL